MMLLRSRGRAVLACLILLASAAALAAPRVARKPARPAATAGLPRYGMAVYSDLCIHPDTGEYGGQRVTIQRFAEVDTVIYEYTAGGLSWPLVASDVNIDPRGRQLYFVVEPPQEEQRTISGKLADDGRTLVLDGHYCDDGTLPMRLPKVQDFGRQPAVCKACPQGKPGPVPEAEPQPAPSAPDDAPAAPANKKAEPVLEARSAPAIPAAPAT